MSYSGAKEALQKSDERPCNLRGTLPFDEIGQCRQRVPGQPALMLSSASGDNGCGCRRAGALKGQVQQNIDIQQETHDRRSTEVLAQQVSQARVIRAGFLTSGKAATPGLHPNRSGIGRLLL
ncbi:hypothetical protein BH20PSE1_BH20PSE1_14000 [soil metagenome]